MRSLIELHPELSKTNELLARIAHALERIVTHVYGLPLHDPKRREEDEASYRSDSDIIKDELEKEFGIKRIPLTKEEELLQAEEQAEAEAMEGDRE